MNTRPITPESTGSRRWRFGFYRVENPVNTPVVPERRRPRWPFGSYSGARNDRNIQA